MLPTFQVHVRAVSGIEAAVLAAAAFGARLEALPAPRDAAATSARAALTATAMRRAAASLASAVKAYPVKLLHASRGEFWWDVCGAKSMNIAKLHAIAASSDGLFTVPPSVTLPFGTCEALLALPENADVASALRRHLESAYIVLDQAASTGRFVASPRAVPGAAELEAARAVLSDGLLPDKATVAALVEALAEVGEKAEALPALWRGVKLVWASKWTDRAVLSRRAQRVPDELLNIAVLIQVNDLYSETPFVVFLVPVHSCTFRSAMLLVDTYSIWKAHPIFRPRVVFSACNLFLLTFLIYLSPVSCLPLMKPIVPARYAFVLHTANPLTENRGAALSLSSSNVSLELLRAFGHGANGAAMTGLDNVSWARTMLLKPTTLLLLNCRLGTKPRRVYLSQASFSASWYWAWARRSSATTPAARSPLPSRTAEREGKAPCARRAC